MSYSIAIKNFRLFHIIAHNSYLTAIIRYTEIVPVFKRHIVAMHKYISISLCVLAWTINSRLCWILLRRCNIKQCYYVLIVA